MNWLALIVLIAAWIVAQLVGLLFGGWGLLGFSQGEPISGVFGVIALAAPTVIGLGAIWQAWGTPPAAAAKIFLVAAGIMAAGVGFLLLLAAMSGPR